MRKLMILLILSLVTAATAQAAPQDRGPAERTALRRSQENDLQTLLDAQRERYDQLLSERRDLEQQKKDLEERTRELERKNRELREALDRHGSYEISEVYVNDVFVTDRSIAVELGTDQLGRVGAALYHDGNKVETVPPPAEMTKTHVISFTTGVLPERSYRIEVLPQDRSGQPLRAGSYLITQRDLARLNVTAPARTEPPVVTLHPPQDGDWESDRIVVRYHVNKESFVVVECKHWVPVSPAPANGRESVVERPCPGKGRFEPVSGVRRPSGDIRAVPDEERTLVFDNLRPDTRYEFVVHAYDERFGHRSTAPEASPDYRTAKPKPAFGFQGPLQITLGADGLEASWEATATPRSATLELKLGPSTTLAERGATIEGDKVTILIPQHRLLGALRKDEGERQALPQIRAEMRNEKNDIVYMDVLLGITMPSDRNDLSRDVKKVLERLESAAADAPDGEKSKYSLADLAIALIPILVSAL